MIRFVLYWATIILYWATFVLYWDTIVLIELLLFYIELLLFCVKVLLTIDNVQPLPMYNKLSLILKHHSQPYFNWGHHCHHFHHHNKNLIIDIFVHHRHHSDHHHKNHDYHHRFCFQASDFTTNSIVLSRQILLRLEDINTRFLFTQFDILKLKISKQENF